MEQYDLDLKLAIEVKVHTVKFILDPNKWGNLTLPVTLNWTMIPFHQNQVQNVPNDKVGVYSFIVKPDIANHTNCSYLMYVGQTTHQSFRLRYTQYLHDQRTKKGRLYVVHMLSTWPEHLWFCYAPIQQVEYIGEIEDRLKIAYVPPVNRDWPAETRGAMALWRR